MSPAGQRIMRIPLPVTLIREMDTVILEGLGGYTTRAEFIVDAIQERILELSVGVIEDAGAPPNDASIDGGKNDEAVEPPSASTPPVALPMTALTPPSAGATIDFDADLSHPERRPLFGLHNRDYPSLWALAQLAQMTTGGLVPAESFFTETLREAWQFGKLLLSIEEELGIKCAALFPTNPEKKKAAEMRFRSFAIGDYRPAGDVWITSGPLFEWRLAGLAEGDENGPLIGITPGGWKILQATTGVSVEEPRPAAAAAEFLGYLTEHAPADERGFKEIAAAIGSGGATRQEVLSHIKKSWPDWTENEVSTNSTGYIARAREWGLVEPKQANGRYHLTALGHNYVSGGK